MRVSLRGNCRNGAGNISLPRAPSSGGMGPDPGRCAALRSSAAKDGKGGGAKKPTPVCLCLRGELGSMLRPTICLIAAANQQVNATPGRQTLVGRDQTADLGDDRCRWEKKAIKHCFKDGNGATGGKLLLTVICRIAPRIRID